MKPEPSDASSVQGLWAALNATHSVAPRDDCPGGRFCTQAGVVSEHCEPSTGALDTEIYAQARRGFGALSLAMAVAAAVGFVLTHLAGEGTAPVSSSIRQALLFLGSLGMFALTRHPRLCPRTVARWGQAYQFGGALIIAFSAFGAGLPPVAPGQLPGLPPVAAWLAVWIVIFPLVAPSRPWKTVALAFASASSVPLALLSSEFLASSALRPSWSEVFLASALFYVAAGVALVPALLLQGLSRGISAARHQLSSLQTYQLHEQLGAGGMGEVWRAEHLLLKRPAAIKIIRPQRLQGHTLEEQRAARTRFEREATTTASLRSPHTVDLYDFGHTEAGDYFYVMELLEGVTLEQLVEDHGPLPPERVVHLLAQACASLAEAHERGLVHRDLKPANLMACRLGLEVDFLKVLDFGLVTMANESARDIKLTGDDSVMGTPAYMAPEQGRGDPATPESDVYALGCVAYWLLTGTTVFSQEKAVPMILDHIGTPPPPPSTRTEQPIPAELEALVLACLAKAPADRPPSAAALARSLRAIPLERPWTPERAEAWWKRELPRASQTASGAQPVTRTGAHLPEPDVAEDPRLTPTVLIGR